MACETILNDHFLFLIHTQDGKVVLSTNNYLLILIFCGMCYTYSNNKNTTTTPRIEFREYFLLKAISQI